MKRELRYCPLLLVWSCSIAVFVADILEDKCNGPKVAFEFAHASAPVRVCRPHCMCGDQKRAWNDLTQKLLCIQQLGR